MFDLLTGRNSGLELAREVFYDTADIGTRFALNGLRRLVGPEKIVFGSNAPFADENTIASFRDALAA